MNANFLLADFTFPALLSSPSSSLQSLLSKLGVGDGEACLLLVADFDLRKKLPTLRARVGLGDAGGSPARCCRPTGSEFSDDLGFVVSV